ncbi:MAG: DUF4402 domain-containing protein [Sphingomonadaceae bacterium]|nr:DUF4402 domain-containing protein [Sphingomonadaceae bacterium]
MRGAAACALLAAAPPALAKTATATGNAITLKPLSIVKLQDLDFGTAAVGAAAGTIVIDPDTDGRSTTGGVVPAGGAPHAAQFYTYGGPLQTVQVNRGPLPVLNRSGGGATMNVTQLTLNGPVLRFLDTAGLLDLRVGGTLAVGANQLAGDYSGIFQIIVTYF